MNSDCQNWIADTFVRECDGERLRIKPIAHDIVLNQDQALYLMHYLRIKFCINCAGTGIDEEGINGKCEYCGELPF